MHIEGSLGNMDILTLATGYQLAMTALSGVVLYLAIKNRFHPRSIYFLLLVLTAFLYNVGYVSELTSFTLESATLARRFQHATMPFVALFYFLYLMKYYTYDNWKKWVVPLLLAYPSINAILILSGDFFFPYYENFAITSTIEGSPFFATQTQPLYYLFIIYSCTFILIGFIFVAIKVFNTESSLRRYTLVFVGTSVIPIIFYLTVLFSLGSAQFDSIPGSLAIMTLVITIFMSRFRMLEWVPIARDQIIENINEAYILLDPNNRFLDGNSKASIYFPSLSKIKVGEDISKIEGFPKELLAASDETRDFVVNVDNNECHLRSSITPIETSGNTVCKCILMHDISEINALLVELNNRATHDTLTGLYNRGYFFKLAAHEYALSQIENRPLTLILLDIDYFKKINDRFGHQCGDFVLETLAKVMKKSIRQTDILCRYGGEEFLIMMPNTNFTNAKHVAENLRRVVEVEDFTYEGETHNLTISLGVATQSDNQYSSLEEMIKAADVALYMAKEKSRNIVCFDVDLK